MTAIPLDFANPATRFDAVLRYHVPSRTRGHETYLVELDAYSGNGCCQCKDFVCNFEPILSRMIKSAEAIDRKLVKVRKGKRPEDALRCWHIVEARAMFADDAISAFHSAELKRRTS